MNMESVPDPKKEKVCVYCGRCVTANTAYTVKAFLSSREYLHFHAWNILKTSSLHHALCALICIQALMISSGLFRHIIVIATIKKDTPLQNTFLAHPAVQ